MQSKLDQNRIAQRVQLTGIRLQRGSIVMQIPLLLLAMALVAMFYLWTITTGKNDEIAKLKESHAIEIAALKNEDANSATAQKKLKRDYLVLLNKKPEQSQNLTDLKRELSAARAQNQRAQHSLVAKDQLADRVKVLNGANDILAMKISGLPAIQKELSVARAANQRGEHVSAARDRLVVNMQNAKAANEDMAEQLAVLPDLKQQLSYARAQNQRTAHIGAARDKLQANMQEAGVANADMKEQLAVLPDLKQQLSYARAQNQRTAHIGAARDRLQTNMQEVSVANADMKEQLAVLPDLKRQLSFARAQNQRTASVSAARDNLMQQLRDLQNNDAIAVGSAGPAQQPDQQPDQRPGQQLTIKSEGVTFDEITQSLEGLVADVKQAETSKDLGELPDLKKQLSAANAQNARLQHVSTARDSLMRQLREERVKQQNTVALLGSLKELEKHLTNANSEAARLQDISKSLDKLIAESEKVNGVTTN